jgi:hypothetical protein
MRRWRRWRFAWPLIPNFVLRKEAARLDDQSLLGAWHLPEHTRSAKGVITDELAKRGYSSQRAADWLSPPSQTRVPPTVGFTIPTERYHAMVRGRARLIRPFRLLGGLLLVLSLLYGAIGDDHNTETSDPVGTSKSSVSPSPPLPPASASRAGTASQADASPRDLQPEETISPGGPLNSAVLPPYLRWIAHSLGALFVVAGIGFFLIAGVATWGQRHRALRLLLLRPFGPARITKAVKRLVLRHLGPYGLVYTLEDRNYQGNALDVSLLDPETWINLVWAALLRQPILLTRITKERAYAKFALALTGRWQPSFESLLNGGQAFTIRSRDVWWKMVINLLINSSDIVFMDVSHVGQGSAWEINQLETRLLFGKCIFVVQTEHENEARAVFGKLLPATCAQLFVYNDRGEFIEGPAFDAALAGHMTAALAAWGTPEGRETERRVVQSTEASATL